jgi:hypothetical protein
MDSFLGGKKLRMRSDATMEYTLAANLLTPAVRQYNLTCLVCTVHMNGKPVLYAVWSDSDDDDVVAVLSAEFSSTMIMVGDSPVVVELDGPEMTNTTLTFAR